MRIILDAMGGDNAPLSPLEGAARAVKELGIEVVLSGNENQLRALAKEHGIALNGISFLHTEDVITMEDQPTEVVKSKKNCSMAVGLQALADGNGDAFVSAGNSGALLIAFGKVADQAGAHILKAGQLQQILYMLGAHATAHLPKLAAEAQILFHRHIHIKRRDLRQISDALTALKGILHHIIAIQRDGSLCDRNIAGDHIHGGGFARTIPAKKSQHIALPGGKADPLHRVFRAVSF